MDWFVLCAYLVSGVAAFFLQTVVHEAAHAACVLAFDGKVVRFIPWPHTANGKKFFGRMVWLPPPGGITPTQDAIISIAPFVVNVITILVVAPLMFLYIGEFSYGLMLLNVLGVSSVIDATAFVCGGLDNDKDDDASEFISGLSIMGPKSLWIVSCVVLALLATLTSTMITFCIILPHLF